MSKHVRTLKFLRSDGTIQSGKPNGEVGLIKIGKSQLLTMTDANLLKLLDSVNEYDVVISMDFTEKKEKKSKWVHLEELLEQNPTQAWLRTSSPDFFGLDDKAETNFARNVITIVWGQTLLRLDIEEIHKELELKKQHEAKKGKQGKQGKKPSHKASTKSSKPKKEQKAKQGKKEKTCETSKKGKRPSMEDESLVAHKNGWSLFGVFDGHGGKEYSEALREQFAPAIFKAISKLEPSDDKDVIQAIETACDKLDAKIHKDHPKWTSGSCAIALLRKGKYVYMINVGDSRLVLFTGSGTILRSTKDQVPDAPEETKRIKAAGGFVKDGRVNGLLGPARAFGDYDARFPALRRKNAHGLSPVVATPVVTYYELPNSNTYAVLFCDGVWEPLERLDVFSQNTHIVDLIIANLGEETHAKICNIVAKDALDSGSTDNVSVMIVELN